jgi:ankyrin repeat protein
VVIPGFETPTFAVVSAQEMAPPCFFDRVPNEIILMIGDLLAPCDLSSLIRTSRLFLSLLDSRLYDLAKTYEFKDEKWGRMPVIEWTSIYGRPTVLRKLMEKGAEIHVTDREGWTLLHNAIEFGHEALFSMLLDAGIDPSFPKNDGDTSLHQAALRGNVGMVRSILATGCDPDVPGQNGRTPLYSISPHGYAEVAQSLLDAGASVSVTFKESRETPLHVAVENGHVDLAEVLIKGGADVNVADDNGTTPLHGAVSSGRLPAVKLLVQHTKDFEVKDGVTGTVLHSAVRVEHIGIIEILLSLGADPLQTDGYGLSCMDWASAKESIFELMKPFCRKTYQPADEMMTSMAVKKSIVRLAGTMLKFGPYKHDNQSYQLAKVLLFRNDVSEARTAIALYVSAKFNGRYVCDMCYEGLDITCDVCSDVIEGDCYMCRRCPDIDICSACHLNSRGSPEIRLCRGHQFDCIELPPPEAILFDEDDVVNERGESREQWLTRLMDSYGS